MRIYAVELFMEITWGEYGPLEVPRTVPVLRNVLYLHCAGPSLSL